MHGPTLSAAAPYTFFLPQRALIDALRVGDHAKVGFAYDPPGEQFEAERMWVLITDRRGDGFRGTIDNDPAERIVSFGDSVEFTRDHILDVSFAEGKAAPTIPRRREYWDRCMVDACVLIDGVPVEYIYREEPTLAGADDKHPDSGWRLRGRQGDNTSEDMQERKAAYVAIGAVLNRDDSWLQLIDAPVGSAFMRDFDAGIYVPVTRG